MVLLSRTNTTKLWFLLIGKRIQLKGSNMNHNWVIGQNINKSKHKTKLTREASYSDMSCPPTTFFLLMAWRFMVMEKHKIDL